MQVSDLPTQFALPFGDDAGPSYITFPIPTDSQVGTTDGAASLETGFPPLNFVDTLAGGVPPSGKDMNGVLKMLSLWARWQGAGGPVFYDATQVTEIGGYPKGAILLADDYTHLWINGLDNNTTDPDAGGSNWTSMHQANGLAGASRNLVGSSSGGVKTAAWTADQLVAATSLTGTTYTGTSLSLSFNGAGTGANGMDTGSTPTSNNLYLYAIFNPTTGVWATLGTISGTGATIYAGANMPSGYTASCLIAAFVTNSSGQFLAFSQIDRRIMTTAVSILSNTSGVGTLTAQSIATAVPAIAKTVCGALKSTAEGSIGTPFVSSSTTGIGTQIGIGTSVGIANFTPTLNFVEVRIITAQTIYWLISSVASSWDMSVTGYTF